MQAFIWYLLKVGICIAAFWLLYRLLLSRDTFHSLNRAVLLASTVLAFLIPAGFVTLPAEASGPRTLYRHHPPSETNSEPTVSERLRHPNRSRSHRRRNRTGPYPPNTARSSRRSSPASSGAVRRSRCCACWPPSPKSSERYAPANERASTGIPCSYIQRTIPYRSAGCATSSSRAATGGNHEEQIIAHERAHLRLGHSWDLLLLDAAGCLQWFNPFMRLLRRELQDIHEYEADRAVLRAGFNPKEYQMLLIKKAAGAGRYSVADGLGHSNLKKRITMMLKKDSESRARWKVLAMLPLACLALTAFAQRECGKDNIIYTDESHITLEYPSAEGTVSKQLHVLFNDSKTPARYLCADLSFNRFADIHTATLTVRPTNWADRTYNPNRFYIALDRTREPKAYDDIFDIVREYAPELYATIPTEYLQYPIPSELRFNKGWYTLQLHIGGGDTKNTLQQYNNIITLESEAKEDGNPALTIHLRNHSYPDDTHGYGRKLLYRRYTYPLRTTGERLAYPVCRTGSASLRRRRFL